jgi:hypothetical protein
MEQVEIEKAMIGDMGRFATIKKSFGRRNLRRLLSGMLVSEYDLSRKVATYPSAHVHSDLLPDGWDQRRQLLQPCHLPISRPVLFVRLPIRHGRIRRHPVRRHPDRHVTVHRPVRSQSHDCHWRIHHGDLHVDRRGA